MEKCEKDGNLMIKLSEKTPRGEIVDRSHASV